jgi:DNA-binding response OmpR family regulator
LSCSEAIAQIGVLTPLLTLCGRWNKLIVMKRIIIVDDDAGIRDVFTFIFNPKEYDVSIYSEGSAILDGKCKPADLYILDKQLADADGLDICRFLKAQKTTKDIPVIMFSASPDIVKLASLAGANDILEKPFKIDTLRKMVDHYTNSSKRTG